MSLLEALVNLECQKSILLSFFTNVEFWKIELIFEYIHHGSESGFQFEIMINVLVVLAISFRFV